MAHWKDAAVTNEGVEMLNEWMAGRKICIVAAFGGTGTVDKELLTEQTGLVDARQELYLLGEEDSTDGKTVQVQVQNATVMEEYELNQVGVYAALDVKKDEDAPEEIRAKMKLLFIMQDEKGVTIPAAMKLRRDSIDRMKARVRSWRKDYPAGAVGRDKIITSWRAWDAHASHGDTYRLREKIAAQVSEIVGMTLTARKPIRKSKTSEAKKLIQKMRRQGKIKPKPPEVPAGFPW